jgi:hypothetical protein
MFNHFKWKLSSPSSSLHSVCALWMGGVFYLQTSLTFSSRRTMEAPPRQSCSWCRCNPPPWLPLRARHTNDDSFVESISGIFSRSFEPGAWFLHTLHGVEHNSLAYRAWLINAWCLVHNAAPDDLPLCNSGAENRKRMVEWLIWSHSNNLV